MGRLAPWLLLAVAAVAIARPLWGSGLTGGGLAGHVLLLGVSACAVAASAAAAVAAGRPKARLAWSALTAAAGSGLLAELFWLQVQPAGGAGGAVGAAALAYAAYAGFFLFLMMGAVLALRPARGRRHAAQIGLDGALLVAGGLAVALGAGLAPDLPLADEVGLVGGLLAFHMGLVALAFPAALLLMWRETWLSSEAATGVAAAAAAFGIGQLLTLIGLDEHPMQAGDSFDLIWIGAWLLLAASALAELARPDAATATFATRLARRARETVAPATAALLGLAAFAMAPDPAVGAALGLVGLLLSARILQALRGMERESETNMELAHTRVLVELSHALAGTPEIDSTLELVTQWAAKLLDARAAGIELLTEDGMSLELRAGHGLSGEYLGLHYPVADSFTGWVVANDRPRATENAMRDTFIQPQSRVFLGRSAVAAVPLRFRDRALGALYCIREQPFGEAELELLGALADQAAIAIETARLFEQVRFLSLTDPLTGLANRRQLERDLAREFAAARRGRRVCAVMFDLDGFKQYNDRHGHLQGDEALRVFAGILASETRAMNLAARYGGDEFVVLLADSDEAEAGIFVERIRERFREAAASLGPDYLGVSAGVAAYASDMASQRDLIDAADRSLYEEKAKARAQA